MSEMSERARSKAKSKVDRLVRADPKARVDASSYTPPDALDADVQTGPRPVSRRQFRRGGKVPGEKAAVHAGRKQRKSGGVTTIDGGLLNRDVKEANESREGLKHIGGMKKGGRAKRDMGGLALPNWADSVSRKSGGSVHGKGCDCAKCSGGRVGRSAGGVLTGGTRPMGGRLARASGGRSKKGMNVNIIIAPAGAGAKPPMPPPAAMPAGAPVGMHQGAPPPIMPPGAAPPMGPPPGGPPMMRKSGGRTGYPIDAGAGGGKGRLEKARAYGG
jgi:hypothetical protein